MSKVSAGTVKWFDPKKGFGFITRDGDSIEVFVHFTGIISIARGRRNLVAGDRVKFEIDVDSKGTKAVRVTRAA